jgi:hypothetical protein
MIYGIHVSNKKLPESLPDWVDVEMLCGEYYVTHNNFHRLARLIGCQELNCPDVIGFREVINKELS